MRTRRIGRREGATTLSWRNLREHTLDRRSVLGPVSGRLDRVWTQMRRPAGILEGTRWLFAVFALVGLVISIPEALDTTAPMPRLLIFASSISLALSWWAGYLRKSAPLPMDILDGVAITVFAASCAWPAIVLGIVFAALWFRSLYGSTRRAVLRCALYAGGLCAVLPLWPFVPGHVGSTLIGALVGPIPTMFLTLVVGRRLAAVLAIRERAALLDAVHVSVGSRLLGVTDVSVIRRIAVVAIGQICLAIPGLRVLRLVRDGEVLRSDGAAGGVEGVPTTLPETVVSDSGVSDPAGRTLLGSQYELDAWAGAHCVWLRLPWPDRHDEPGRAWLLVGAPRGLPAEADVALASLANLVALALRNSAVHRELTVQAMLDGLTGLANRATFTTALAAELDQRTTGDTSILFVDLDDFKNVNDGFGHQAGDALLREIAVRLRQATRPNDLCARLGGDEFAVLLRDTGEGAATTLARRIVDTVAAPVHLDSGVVHVGASVGVAAAANGTMNETTLEHLIHRADVAMYAAKAQGKSRIQVFEPGLLPGVPSQAPSAERQLTAATDL
ncbi:GGDEF domain-containing protein [Pengzhenrongella sp.]|jgi:diguanylate cyclase (GGDEF)-like protein|uniref:GGDEF domain-containing protein n=1 Tax=Pengzhenrongella sp. TaxID=2888820 RepID=UPI002F948390